MGLFFAFPSGMEGTGVWTGFAIALAVFSSADFDALVQAPEILCPAG